MNPTQPRLSTPKPRNNRSATEISLQLAGLGTELAAPVLLGAFVSIRYQWGIIPVLAGMILGILTTVTHVLVFLRKNPDMHGKNPANE